jgi:uncharacterized protein YjbI with pentapeptide repeats
MSEKDLTGKSLEMEVADLYRQLRSVERVERDTRIGGNQIDVYVKRRTKDGSLRRIAVEVKDYDRSVPLAIVSTYASKVNLMRDGGLIDGGAIVAREDFTPDARKTAEVARLPLLTLADLKKMVEEEQQSPLKGPWRWVLVVFILILVAVILVLVFSWGSMTELARNIGASTQQQLGRGLWDWTELLLVPAVLALGAWWLNRSAGQREAEARVRQSEDQREIEALRAKSQRELERETEAQRAERQWKLELVRSREAALQAYFDQLAELIKDARGDPVPESSQQALARARTLTVLHQLDRERKGLLLRFLYESGLIGRREAVENPPGEPEPPTGVETERATVQLSGADLSGAVLTGANLDGAELAGTNLRMAQLDEASLNRTKLNRAKMDGANLREAELSQATLVGSSLTDAFLVGVKLTDANLTNADLTKAILSKARLDGADLSKANLSEADLGGADLSKAILEGATMTPEQLGRASSLTGIILTGGDLRQAQLGTFNLSDANLSGADLSGAILWEAQLDGANLTRTNLSNADLTRADLSKARLEGANLTGADLSRASLKGAELAGCRLEGATVMQEQLDQANSLEGAILPDGTVYTPPKEPDTLNGVDSESPSAPDVPVLTLPE